MIDLSQCCIEKFIEECAAQINIVDRFIILLCMYRSPSEKFGEFAVQLDLILKYLYTPKLEFICGDFNIIFLIDSLSFAQQLTLLLHSHNLFHIADFPTRTTKDSSSATDNIFIDYNKINSFQVFSLINGLSDHKAQYLCVNNIFDQKTGYFRLVRKRLITQSVVSVFTEMVRNESWDNTLLYYYVCIMYY
jgi:hypothetical protein